ncbi:MAG: hypothetical protein ACOCXS_03930, partial [Bacteroidota bacterium]
VNSGVLHNIRLSFYPEEMNDSLRLNRKKNYTLLVSGKVVDLGFALIIFTAVGMNHQVFFGEPMVLLRVAMVLRTAIIAAGFVYEFISLKMTRDPAITMSRLLTQLDNFPAKK